MTLRVEEVGVQTPRKRELALSGLTRRPQQPDYLSTYLRCGKCI